MGVGHEIDVSKPYLLVVLHPTTTDISASISEVRELLACLDILQLQTIWIWPNLDAGSNQISTYLRQYRESKSNNWLRLVKNYPSEIYQALLASTACAVGNSSSFVRDTSFSGTPVVLVGNRQSSREKSDNVITSSADTASILKALSDQLGHGSYPPSDLYGDGSTSSKIISTIKTLKPYIQKRLMYP